MKKFVCILLVVVLMFALAAVALGDNVTSAEKDNTSVNVKDDGASSPQTGDNGAIFFAVAALVLSMGAVLFCGKKLILDK